MVCCGKGIPTLVNILKVASDVLVFGSLLHSGHSFLYTLHVPYLLDE